MKQFETKWIKYIAGAVGGIIAGCILMFGGVKVVYPAISQLVGLSVAQSSTLWNSVIDAAKGDALSSGILGQSPYLWNGLTFDRQRGSIANGALVDVTRLNGAITAADGYTNPTTLVQALDLPLVFNGTTWDRQRSASGVNNIQTTVLGAQQVTPLSTWSIINTTSAAATAATVTKASGGGTVRHVATGVTICHQDTAGAANVVRIVNLRDGASGAGTILRTWFASDLAGGGFSGCQSITGLNMTGSAATAMTLEFAAAPLVTASETVTLTGYSTP